MRRTEGYERERGRIREHMRMKRETCWKGVILVKEDQFWIKECWKRRECWK